ncbi:urea ABC transporter ATP-binding subunit UrtE [Paenarthrobacter sp. Z7-10]|uniref:urea ABC transporter ATP-binding subunit UrtE n=1 Tax=Paenarthrobacter sp. Z7-10 TaxID=2787635 RepID=UPI0022A98EA6|nr:urea ABC transporter ATP-binding subunit UrtE [Paenarthrobacter sp. Z7-10]MCZ2404475.1 urea ABC transporter ATP-binding subunit UrtE [Paenarthrobacter sp. Z7-10]
MLQIRNVSAGYGRTPVLHNITADVSNGQLVALLGRNGVGKTTLLRTITGEISATSGEIHISGKPVTKLKAHERARAGIAYVPQGRQIFSDLTVLENLRVAGYASKKSGWQEIVDELLEQFPILNEKKDQNGGSLSGGQQQILALGRALVTKPDLLLLDEPSEGIQPSIVQQIAKEIKDINKRRGITVVIVEQNLEFAASVADVAYVMDKGQIVQKLQTDHLLADVSLQHELLGI